MITCQSNPIHTEDKITLTLPVRSINFISYKAPQDKLISYIWNTNFQDNLFISKAEFKTKLDEELKPYNARYVMAEEVGEEGKIVFETEKDLFHFKLVWS